MTSRPLVAIAVLVCMLSLSTTAAGAAPDYRPQITNGTDASVSEYPFMAALLTAAEPANFDAQFCGASLITEEWVLSAAHCVVEVGEVAAPDSVEILVGGLDLAANDGERVPVSEIFAHPDYDDTTSQNDLALLHLETATDAPTISWADETMLELEAPGTIATLTGWGGLTTDQEDQTYATDLQEADMPVISAAECAAMFEEFDGTGEDVDAATMLCAGAPEDDADGGIDACQGDSGGPLFTVPDGDSDPVQIGIVSFGPSCGLTPTAYTRVSQYADWISETIGAVDDGSDLEHVDRLAGANRFATAAALATDRFPVQVETAFVVTGASFPDALAAAASAASLQAPILLTQRDTIPQETIDALEVLDPGAIVVVGGTGVISDAVATQLETFARTAGVRRIAGVDRYDTAAQLSVDAFPEPVGDEGLPIVLASGESFADALGGAAAAASAPPSPLLLTTRTALPTPTRDELVRHHPDTVFVIGGTAAIDDAVVAEVEALGIDVTRLAGADRYATSAAIATTVFGGADEVFVATGTNFPDGLVAGALGVPLLLVPPTGIPASIVTAIDELAATTATIFGGSGAVSDEQAQALDDVLAS